MLEVLFLIWFCKQLAGMARDKGRSGGWGSLGAILWLGGEVGGAILGISSASDAGAMYGYAILGALVGAVVAYVIVATLERRSTDEIPIARVV
jgi:hypothetical protein